MNHEKTTVYPSEDEQMYRIPNQENGLGTNENLIGRLKEGEYDPKQEYQLVDTEGTPYHAVLTGLVELNSHQTFDTHNTVVHDRLVQVEITERQKVDANGDVYNARGLKWIRVGDLINQMHVKFNQGERERKEDSAKIGSAALKLIALDNTRREIGTAKSVSVSERTADNRIAV